MSTPSRAYFAITGTLFVGAALLHVFRLLNHWTVQIGSWTVPYGFSFVGLPLAAFLGVWGYRQFLKSAPR